VSDDEIFSDFAELARGKYITSNADRESAVGALGVVLPDRGVAVPVFGPGFGRREITARTSTQGITLVHGMLEFSPWNMAFTWREAS